MKKFVIIFLLFVCLCGCNSDSNEKVESKKVSCDEKNEILKNEKDAMLIDVRTNDEFDLKHLENAINIPYDTIVEGLDTYGTVSFDTPIIVYCKSGGRSAQAAESLVNAGYKNIYDLGASSNFD